MEDLRTVEKLIAKDYFMGTIDIEDAFHSIPIHRESRKYLRFAEFVGYLVSCTRAIAYSPLYCKLFERERYLALIFAFNNYDKVMSIPSYLKEDLNWWKMAAQNGKNPIRYGDYKLEIYTDASLTGWGAYANNTITNGFWNDSEREWHINCLELQAIFFGLKCFASKLTNCEILLRCDNVTAISYVNKLGGVQHKRLNNLARDIWKFREARGLWLFATYIPSKANVNADAASRIKNIDTEWELSDKAFKRIESDFGPFDVDLFASRLNNKCKTFCSWHQDPDALITDAFTIPWKNKKFYAFPPFSLILKTLRKIINEEAEGEDLTSISREDVPDGRTIIRQAFEIKGYSEEATKILMASLATSTIKQYSSGLIDWWRFCKAKRDDPFDASNNIILQFLTKKFDAGASYGTINTIRSAISLISARDLSNDATISRFVKGVFRLRPQKAKYSSSWDPEVVLSYIEKMTEPLSFQELSEKTLVSLALCTAHRSQTFALIDINNISNLGTELQIKIPDLIKTSKPGAMQPNLILPFFKERPKLCAASSILKYIEVSKSLREDRSRLFISTRKPYKDIGSQTISRWIKSMLNKAGIDTSRFTGHSTRHVSASTANRNGIDIRTIKLTAGWSEKSTVFARFYNQPVERSNGEFAASILSKK
ncbi:hypothetical protein TKK_0000049 [Trichogramma kaykai]